MRPTLLPSGLHDLLPPRAAAEARIVRDFTKHFQSFGYQLVSPPLAEFQDSYKQQDRHCFSVLDPESQQMMTIRADMTMQIARIARSLLIGQPRPLRLCYAGQTLRSKAEDLRKTRQFRQIGIELFGADGLHADVEIMQLMLSGLKQLGFSELSLDINFSYIFDELTESLSDADKASLTEAVKRKDMQTVNSFDVPVVSALCRLSGAYEDTLPVIEALDAPACVAEAAKQARAIVEALKARLGHEISVTLDPLELRGFGYYSGISFSIFLKDLGVEVGRGGRYETSDGETATGFTLYSEDLVDYLPQGEAIKQIVVPSDCDSDSVALLKEQGYMVCYALNDTPLNEAAVIGAAYYYENNEVLEVDAS
ncbi:MAG: ATP phosphoribosyltransferase regulatory subunit [Rickettsiales bacterium]|nr:ATP phosphoribosyltransferase regulatory subunit [Rickettsiales bacterium]